MSAVVRPLTRATRYGKRLLFEPDFTPVREHLPMVVHPDVRRVTFPPKTIRVWEYDNRVRMERNRAQELQEKLFEAHYKSRDIFRRFPEMVERQTDLSRPPDYSDPLYFTKVKKLMKHTLYPMFYQQAATLASTVHLGKDIGLEDELTMLYFLNEVVEPMARFALDDSPPPHWLTAMGSPILSLAQPALNVIHVGTNTHILKDFPFAFDKTFAELGVLPTVNDYSNSYATVQTVSDVTAPALQLDLGMNLWTAALQSPITPLVHGGIFKIRNYPYWKAVKHHEGEEVEVTYPLQTYIESAKKTKLPPFAL